MTTDCISGGLRTFISAVALCLLTGGIVQARELHWRSLDVQGRLDPDGVLHVLERHEMVFTGDWNGGERIFRLEPGQTLDVSGVARLVDGRPVLLEEGSLDEVDRWASVGGKTIRWRARLPDDPPFNGDVLTYEIAYVMTGVVDQQSGDSYRLRHDFAIPEGEGEIEQFRVRLALDEPWVSPRGRVIEETSTGLQPGESHVVRLSLTYSAPAAPAGVVQVAGPIVRGGAVGVLVAALLLTFVNWLRRESSAGRLTPLPDVTPAGIESELRFWRPEVLGAAWDEKVSAPEVAAVLARLAQEGKITTAVKDGEMSMTLDVPREGFTGMDRALVDAFFISGNQTSTAAIREHYSDTGFSPASVIQKPLLEQLSKIRGWSENTRRRPWTLTLGALAAALVSLATAVGTGAPTGGPLLPILLVGGVVTVLAGSGISWTTSRHPHLTRWSLLAWNMLPLLYALVTSVALLLVSRLTAPIVFAAVLCVWAVYRFTATLAHTTMTAPRIELRRRLYSIREWFREQLEKPDPQLRDEWLPWLVALGLGTNVDRWFGQFGSRTGTTSGPAAATNTGAGAGSPSPSVGGSWSGGATSFGGAGATGMWVTAATGVASGVASPSSGGGGGGGSSSGGGGGGGW